MDTWSLPKARPISCNDCPAFQRDHMSVRWFAENFTRLPCGINTTFREKIYSRWCCIDRLSWQSLSVTAIRGLPHSSGPTSRDRIHLFRFYPKTLWLTWVRQVRWVHAVNSSAKNVQRVGWIDQTLLSNRGSDARFL